MQILTVKTSFYKNETIICEISTPENMGLKKKSPVYLKGEAVQSRNHSSMTIKFKFIKKLKRLPFGNRLTDFVQIFFWLLFLKLFKMSPLSSYFMRVGEQGCSIKHGMTLYSLIAVKNDHHIFTSQ